MFFQLQPEKVKKEAKYWGKDKLDFSVEIMRLSSPLRNLLAQPLKKKENAASHDKTKWLVFVITNQP